MASNWNALMDGMANTPLSPREGQVVAAIARKTLGWRKTADRISASQLAEATGIERSNIVKTLNALERRRIISRFGGSRGRGRIGTVGLNLTTSEWQAPSQRKKVSALTLFAGVEKVSAPTPEKVSAPTHTRGKGVRASAASAEKASLNELRKQAFNAYQGSGGILTLERERGALASAVTSAFNAGTEPRLILAACRDLGRKREFAGLLKQRVKELEEQGGPCQWAGMARMKLTAAQLDECGCDLCAEYAAALAVAA